MNDIRIQLVTWLVVGFWVGQPGCSGPEIDPPLVIAPLPDSLVKGEESSLPEREGDALQSSTNGSDLGEYEELDGTQEDETGGLDGEVQDVPIEDERLGEKSVEVVSGGEGVWDLYVEGEPFSVIGAGGDQHLERLVEMGGNSIRTWGVGPDTPALLDEAHALGLKVTVGLWLMHPEWFDYTDTGAVQAQEEALMEYVEQLKDHPAILMWGVGNELALTVDIPEAWEAINSLAEAIKTVDQHHPTMAVTASGIPSKGLKLKACCPAIDVWGINQYGGMNLVPQWVEEAGWNKAWLITEFGPNGPWETQDTAWGADMEATSSQKSKMYRSAWVDTIAPAMEQGCLGGYAFVWTTADDASDTWFPLFRSDGAPTAAINGIYEAWNETPAADLAPEVGSIVSEVFGKEVDGGQSVEATLPATDPEGQALSMTWIVSKDPFAIDNDPGHYCYVLEEKGDTVTFEAPTEPGPWRLIGWAEDEGGQVSLSAMPFLVGGESGGVSLPLAVDNVYSPNGWMGDVGGLNREDCTGTGFCSPRCHHWTYAPTGAEGWAGAFWLYPEGNWGTAPGLDIAPGATQIVFKAWSDREDVVFNFFAGVGEDNLNAKLEGVTLGTSSQEWSIDLTATNYTTVAGGFGFSIVAPADGEPVNLYLEDIRWVK